MAASVAGAGAQASNVSATSALMSHLGSRSRLWTSAAGVQRPLDGQVQYVHDTLVTVWSSSERRLVELPLSSLDRLAIMEPQRAFAVPAAMAAGVAAGAGAAFFATRRASRTAGPVPGRSRTVTLGALAGAYVLFWVGELAIPQERWVTVFKR
jgi:hypothetical protein